MAKKRRRRFRPEFRGVSDSHAIGIENTRKGFIDWYDKDVHITRSIDERLSKKSARWAAMSQERRYKIIHTALGVQGIFDIVQFEHTQGIFGGRKSF